VLTQPPTTCDTDVGPVQYEGTVRRGVTDPGLSQGHIEQLPHARMHRTDDCAHDMQGATGHMCAARRLSEQRSNSTESFQYQSTAPIL
jgi:hypothetical protein